MVETLTTNANGEATGTHKYTIGTKLYAVEKTAPSGYLLNATPVELTVSAGSNVFNVADTPTFDPAELVITKTGVDSERIQGAVFKAEFYASNWADSTKLLRTWYFSSDSNGFVYIRDDHLASGYSSSSLYKISGDVVFPLGCVVVTEVKTAEGYILPQGNDGKALIFVRQGGTKTAQPGKPAGAYWGDWSANPLNSANPLGIYKIENDADKSKVTAVNPEAYGAPFSLQKYGPSNIPLEGAVFRVDYYHSSWFDSTKLERTWYFKTNSNGYFTLASQYLASGYTSDALFPTGKIPLGIMKVTEEKAPDGFKRVDLMGVWRMRQTESGSTNVESYWAAANGYTPTTSYGDYAYVLDSDPTKLYVLNEPDEAPVEIIKTSTDGAVSGISFKVEQYESGVGWWTKGTYPTDASGKITLGPLTIGTRLRITEIVPENYVCTSTNPQTITVAASGNQVRFTNKPIASLEIVKTSTDGAVAGISFKVEKQASGSWTTLGNYTTDQNGRITVPNLDVGLQLRITETVPENYVCTSTNPQTITLVKGTNRVSFANKPISNLEIIKTSTDGEVAGITFTVEKKSSGNWTALGSYVSDSEGRILIENLDVGLQLRITEIVPEGYECTSDNPQTVTLRQGSNRVSFTNTPIVPLEIIKTSEDGPVEGISFRVEQYEPTAGIGWWEMGTYLTDQDGQIMLDPLPVGTELRITEIVPADSLCLSENPQTITLEKGTNTVNFINRLIRGSLKIIKVDQATRTPLHGAGFRVFNTAGEQIAEGYTDENGGVLFEGLTYGEYTYREFEAPEGFVLDETEYPFAVLEDGQTIEVVRDNQPKEGSITVFKVDENNRPLAGVTFLLEYSVDDGATWAPIQFRDETAPVEAGYCTSAGLNSGKLTTGADGYAVYTGLCIDTQLGAVRYRVTEVETKSGYSLLIGYAFEGTLSEASETEVSFTVVNQPTYKMPSTGGRGFNGLAFVIILGCTAATALFVLARKKRYQV